MRHLEKAHDKPLSEDLAGLIGNMDDEDEPFALLLSHEYTVKSIQDLGTGALKGVDSARFHALKEANALVPTAKQLQFFIVRLTHKIEFDPGWDMDWKPSKHKESMRWYSISGESLGRIRQSTKFNFLNPGQETLSQLWIPHGVQKEEGYMGNEGPSRNTKYARYAIVAWPSAKHAEHAAKIMPLDAAVEVFHAQKPVDAATLRAFMNDWNARLRGEGKYDFLPGTLSIKFTRLFCELAVEAGDSELVRDFFANHCPKLGNQKDNGSLVTVTREIARTFDWKDFGKAFSDFLDQNISTYGDEEGYSSMGLELLILDGLDSGVARDALFSLVAKKSAELTTEDLCSCKVVGLLLKWVVHNSTNSTVDKVTNTFKQLDPSLLRPALLENALECFNGGDANDDKVGLLPLLVSKRIGWLKNQIEMFDKPFSWQMPDAQFSDNAKVEEFLRSPAATMTMTKTKGVRKFKGFQDANNYAAKWTHEAQVNASFKMEASAIYADAVVTITKTPKWFAEGQHTLGQYKAELDRLLEYAVKTNSSNCKRARLE
ncbi:hypothetical protein PR003_g14106 [Phytophthora rubi]|nr:hypothetical protein PR003_g14106 [Phytophthora rubi]